MEDILVNLSQNLNLNSGWAFLIVFISGVLVSFTPCVYPLIPITVSFIGANAGGSRLRGFILSLAYVFGIAVTYSVLGAIAALGGRTFGAILNSASVCFIVANIFLILGLSMCGVFTIPLPKILRRTDIKGQGIWHAFLLGLVSCLVISPCTAPVLGSILVYVGTKQNVLYGMTLLFVFAYGVGALLILIGTFTGLITSLPKSGIWMERIKKVCGIILIIVAEYLFIKTGGLL